MGEPPPLTATRALARGLRLRCPLCGGGDCFESYFRMRRRCPRCNFPFERIEGHWIGALGLNMVVSFGALFLTLLAVTLWTWPEPRPGPMLVLGLAVAVAVPLAFFPLSRTLWSAADLAMRPPEPADDVDPRWLPPAKASRRGRQGGW